MPEIRPGTIVYSNKHQCVLQCFGRNGGRPTDMLGHVVRDGVVDEDSCKIFRAEDVTAVQTPEGLQSVFPGTVAETFGVPDLGPHHMIVLNVKRTGNMDFTASGSITASFNFAFRADGTDDAFRTARAHIRECLTPLGACEADADVSMLIDGESLRGAEALQAALEATGGTTVGATD